MACQERTEAIILESLTNPHFLSTDIMPGPVLELGVGETEMNKTQALSSRSSRRTHKYSPLYSPSLAPGGIQAWLVSLEFHLLARPARSLLPKILRQTALLDQIELASGDLLLRPN